jgi:predicted HicB family RNase H-like nuclease
MRITADTNVLGRAIVADEPKQARLEGASLGASTFASFDKDTVRLLKKLGQDSLLLA